MGLHSTRRACLTPSTTITLLVCFRCNVCEDDGVCCPGFDYDEDRDRVTYYDAPGEHPVQRQPALARVVGAPLNVSSFVPAGGPHQHRNVSSSAVTRTTSASSTSRSSASSVALQRRRRRLRRAATCSTSPAHVATPSVWKPRGASPMASGRATRMTDRPHAPTVRRPMRVVCRIRVLPSQSSGGQRGSLAAPGAEAPFHCLHFVRTWPLRHRPGTRLAYDHDGEMSTS